MPGCSRVSLRTPWIPLGTFSATLLPLLGTYRCRLRRYPGFINAVELAKTPTTELFCSEIVWRGICNRAILSDSNLSRGSLYLRLAVQK